MNRKITLLTILVALMVPSTAAATQWFYDYRPVPPGETVALPLAGAKVTVTYKPFKLTAVKFECSVTGSMSFWNEPAAGRDELQSLSFANCPAGDSVTVTPPWSSTLVEVVDPEHDPFRDLQENVTVDVTYGGVDRGVFTGTLRPVYGDLDPLKEREEEAGKLDEPDSYLTFLNSGDSFSPLHATTGDQAWFTGIVHAGSKEAFITSDNGVL